MYRLYIKFLTVGFFFSLIFSDTPNWDIDGDCVLDDYNAYANNGSISSLIYVDGLSTSDGGELLGAFVDGIQRGVACAEPIPFGPYAGLFTFQILIYSNEVNGETITFQYYDDNTDTIYDINETTEFFVDMTLGNVTSPYFMNTSSSGGDGEGQEQCPSACDIPENTIHLAVGENTSCADCDGEIWYNISSDIGGFQFDLDDGTITWSGNGDAASAGFTVQGSGSTLLGFSFTGSTVSGGCGVLTELSFSGSPSELSGIVFSDAGGSQLEVSYDDGLCDPAPPGCDSGCDLPENSVWLEESAVWYNISSDVGGFQFDVDGATVLGTSGGDAGAAGFTVQGGGSTVLGFSFTGSTVPEGCGTLTELDLSGEATGLSGIVFSDAGGNALTVSYQDCAPLGTPGCTDVLACNFNLEATIDDSSCVYAEENYDCDGNCTSSVDCNGVCNGSSTLDDCGICDGANASQDCAGTCDGDAVVDNCGTCDNDSSNDCIDDCNGIPGGTVFDSDGDSICDDVDECPYDVENDIDGDGLCCSGDMPVQYLRFDGDDDYVEMNPSNIVPSMGDHDNYSIFFDIKIHEFISHSTMFIQRDADGDNLKYFHLQEDHINNGANTIVYKDFGTTDGFTETPPLELDRWYNVGVISNDYDMKLYLDGELVDSVDRLITTEWSSNVNYFLGGDPNNWAADSNCSMDNFSMWSNSISESDIDEQILNEIDINTPGLITYYNFDEGNGNIVYDQTGEPGNWQQGNGEIFGATWVSGGYENDLCCNDAENDSDNDGLCGDVDDCPYDSENDSDNDGVCGDVDTCPGFDDGIDTDNDGIVDGCDTCPLDALNDSDNDGVCGDVDQCPDYDDNLDTDDDGIVDCFEIYGCLDIEAENCTSQQCCETGDFESYPDCLSLSQEEYSTEEDGSCFIGSPSAFNHNISTQLAYYFVFNVNLDDLALSSEDWVGAFNGDVCVGARKWDVESCGGGVCDIPVYGDDGEPFSSGYMLPGDIPTFKVYDYSENTLYDVGSVVTGENIDIGWSNLSVIFIDQLSVVRDCYNVLGGDVFDADNDGCCDDVDLFDDNPTECYDSDADGIGDNADECNGFDDNDDNDNDSLADGCDPDDDNDGAYDSNDDSPFDQFLCSDNDLDGCDDCSSGTYNINNDGLDNDLDSLCDIGDPDDDNDSINDINDSHPFDSSLCSDDDGDSCDDCSSGTFDMSNDGLDFDNDDLCDIGDPDDDGDGSLDINDIDDFNPYLCSDTEEFYFGGELFIGDGCDDCSTGTFNVELDGADYDSDNLCDIEDPCVLDASNDLDGDGVCESDEVYGCNDSSSATFDSAATENDGTCIYSNHYNFNYNVSDEFGGALLVGYSELPVDGAEYPISEYSNLFNSENLYSVLGQENAAFYYNDNWLGSLSSLNKTSGYWIKLSGDDSIDYEALPNVVQQGDGPVFEMVPYDLVYSMEYGPNLFSFPGEPDVGYTLTESLPQELDGSLYYILSDESAAVYDDFDNDGNYEWGGSLSEFEGYKGYWFKSSSEITLDFSFNVPDGAVARQAPIKETLDGFEYNISSSRAFYFVKSLPDVIIGDWIVAMHEGTVVGARKWTGQVIDVPAMGYDGETYSEGYLEVGDIPELMVYHHMTGELESLHGSIPAFADNEVFMVETLSDEDSLIPSSVTLNGAYPNPFNPTTSIEFTVPEMMSVKLNVFDIQGRLVQRVAEGIYEIGTHKVTFNGDNLSSGLYFVRLDAGGFSEYTKVMLLK